MANKDKPKTKSSSENFQESKKASEIRKGQTIPKPSSNLNNDSKKK